LSDRPPPHPVERVADLAPEAFARDYLAQGRPVVIAGGAEAWPARAAWAPERLRERLRARTVKVASSEHDVFGYDEAAAAYQVEEMPFAEAADLILRVRPSARRYYLMQQSIAKEFPELAADLPPLPHLGGAQGRPHLWFGSEGNLTPLHYDMANNLFGQLHGSKRFLLFPPEQSELVYPREASSRHHNLSQLDPEAADVQRYPRFADSRPWACGVEPGDLFFLPAFWWHQVRSLTAGISVSTWWAPRPEQFLTPMARRMAPVFYARDRLLTFKGLVAEPGPHQGFLGMARYMAAEGQAAMAVLFAGAALDEALRLAYLKHVKPPDMAALREAGRVTDALLDAGVLDAAAGTRVRAWLALVADALQEPAPALDPAAAAAMAEGVAAFAARR